MSSRDEDRFRVRLKPPRSRGVPRSNRFVAKALARISQPRTKTTRKFGIRPSSNFGRGRVATGLSRPGFDPTSRRVVIKSRFVQLRHAGSGAVAAHLRYIVRGGVTRDGNPGVAYGPEMDTVDLEAFEDRGKGDRRFIVSVEDAEQLEDLRYHTQALMRRVSTDSETPLDWLAVDHWKTDGSHLLLDSRPD